MYNVSDEFRSAMKAPAQTRSLYGTIGNVNFNQKNVLQGTFTITNQCSDNSNIQIGQVYIGELKATFRGLDIPRNGWKNKEIIAYQGLKVNGSFENVLIGHYFIDNANWSKAGVDVTAYDAMSKFDKSLSLTITTSAKLFDYISYACQACKVELGMTEDEISKLPNGKEVLGIYDENDMETYRDLISWCAQTMGANAFINREGKLIFKQYSDIVNDSFNSKQRLDGGKISDFDTFYTGISMVNIKDKTTSYYGAEVDNGLTMNLGSNPLLQYGVKEVLEKQRRAILAAIEKINYTPMTMQLNVPYVYDLMDVLEFTNGIVGEGKSIKAAITKYTWKFNGDYEVECSGSDPALASSKSKVDKNISGLLEQVDAAKSITYKFTNVKDLAVTENFAKIISITFTSKEKASAMFFAQVLLDVTANTENKEIVGIANYTEKVESSTDVSTEGETASEVEVNKEVKFTFQKKVNPTIEVNYKLNNSLDELFMPKQIYSEGSQILTLYYPLLNVKDNYSNVFEVFLKISGGNIAIKKANIIATISGQGLVAEYHEWDGNINIEEKFNVISLNENGIKFDKISDSLKTGVALPKKNAITETIAGITIGDDAIIFGFKDSVGGEQGTDINFVQTQQTVTFDLNEYIEIDADLNMKLKTTYIYTGMKNQIDDGKMCSVKCITSDKVNVEEINIAEVSK